MTALILAFKKMMSTTTNIKFERSLRIIGLLVAISFLLVGFFHYRTGIIEWQQMFPYQANLPIEYRQPFPSYWYILRFHIIFIIAVIMAWQWACIGGLLLMTATAFGYIWDVIANRDTGADTTIYSSGNSITEAERQVILERFGLQGTGYQWYTPIYLFLFVLFVFGLVYIILAYWKRKTQAQAEIAIPDKSDLQLLSGWLMKKWKYVAVVAAVLIITFTSITLWSYRGSANIPDANLKEIINRYYLVTDLNHRIKIDELDDIIAFNDFDYTINDLTGIEHCLYMTRIVVCDNHIADISPLSNLTALSHVELNGNSISDIQPLVDNIGLGSGDVVYLENNPLSSESIDVHIPALEVRGVEVYW